MSSSPSSEQRGRRWLLRTRLIAGLVVLLTLVSLFTVTVTELAVRTFLINQLDAQLAEASDRAASFADPDNGHGPPPDDGGRRRDPLNAPGQATGTLNMLIVGDDVLQAGRLSTDGNPELIPESEQEILAGLPTDGRPHTRDLGELGDYRVTAFTTQQGDVIVTGLPLAPVNRTLLNIGLILGAIALAGLLAAVAIGTWIVRRTLAPLDRVAATAGRVAELPLDSGPIAIGERVPQADTDPRTEVGQVGLGLNRLLDSVEDALAVRHDTEVRVRQFVADASHELRTPLAAVRGYAELVRRRNGSLDPDVAHAISRVESEAARMTTLVEDLLLLARLDSGRPLDDEPVDLSRLVVDVVSDARVAGADHVWRLELPDSPVEVRGDQARLHQVLANLLTNARTHTPPGTTVTVGLSAASSDGRVELRVTDDGPGIPADVLPDVFERFARGDTSRSRAAGSTGLGLAIVEAVVHAHHGDVTAASKPGRTTFTVRLPA